MKTLKIYYAIVETERRIGTYADVIPSCGYGYICEAFSKKQMKAAGMNMRFDWIEIDSFDKALGIIEIRGFDLRNVQNISQFDY